MPISDLYDTLLFILRYQFNDIQFFLNLRGYFVLNTFTSNIILLYTLISSTCLVYLTRVKAISAGQTVLLVFTIR